MGQQKKNTTGERKFECAEKDNFFRLWELYLKRLREKRVASGGED